MIPFKLALLDTRIMCTTSDRQVRLAETEACLTFWGAPFSSLLFSTADRVSGSACVAAAGRRAMPGSAPFPTPQDHAVCVVL